MTCVQAIFTPDAIAACQFAATPRSQCLLLTKSPLLTKRHIHLPCSLFCRYLNADVKPYLRRSGISKHLTPRQIHALMYQYFKYTQARAHSPQHVGLSDSAKLRSRHIPLVHPSIQAQCRYAHLQSRLGICLGSPTQAGI